MCPYNLNFVETNVNEIGLIGTHENQLIFSSKII